MKTLKHIQIAPILRGAGGVLIILLVLFSSEQCLAQNFADKDYYLIDSLNLDELSEGDQTLLDESLKTYHSEKNNIAKMRAINAVCENMVHQSWGRYNDWVYEFSENQLKEKHHDTIRDKYLHALAGALNNKGFISTSQGDTDAGLDYFLQSIEILEDLNEYKGKAMTMNNIATIYNNLGQVAKGLNYFHQSLKILESIKDTNGMATASTNIGYIHNKQGDLDKALAYYFKALEYQEIVGNQFGMANSLSNIGVVYGSKGNYESDLDYSHKSLKIREEIGDKNGQAKCLNNIGYIHYRYLKKVEEAIPYIEKSLALRKETNDQAGISSNLSQLASIAMDRNNLAKAEKLAKESHAISEELGYPDKIQSSAELLSEIYIKQGKGFEALGMYKLHIQMRDSINSEATQKAAAEQSAKHEYEKQKAIDDAHYQKQLLEEKHIEHRQQIIIYGVIIVLILAIVFLFVIAKRLKTTKEQKLVIEEQRDIVEEAHKEIRDSINYAERIQRSFLATDELLNNNLKDYFVFFEPKDVVSGDFYWAGKLSNNQFAVVNADSTGHGVPGAIMSILNISSIEKAIDEKLVKPADIFNHTRNTIIERLKKDGSEEGGKDGMDASIISFDFENNKFSYTAAQNPIWVLRPVRHCEERSNLSDDKIASSTALLRNDEYELIEIKPEKMPIGKHDNDSVPFVGGEFETQKGDVVYTITDGFQDQFGGEKGKKFKVKPFKSYLISIAHLPMNEQKEMLKETFTAWKGEEEQVDDVCVIGVRV